MFLQDPQVCQARRVGRPADARAPTQGEPPVPVLEGQLFHPNGTFADWNTRVSCDGL